MRWRGRGAEDWPCFGWLGYPMRPAGLLGAILVIIATWPLTRRDRAFGRPTAPIARVVARITVPPRLALVALSLPFVLMPFGIYPSQRVFNLLVTGPMGFMSRHGHMMLAVIATAATLVYCASVFRAVHDRVAARAALALSILLPVLMLTTRLWNPIEQAITGNYKFIRPPLVVIALLLAASLAYALLATRLLRRLPRPEQQPANPAP